MQIAKLVAIVALLALFTGAAACDLSGPRPGWISAGCARTLGISSRPDLDHLDLAGLTGQQIAGDPDRTVIEVNGQTTVIAGYAAGKEAGRPRLAILGWDGFEPKKEADFPLPGTGVPLFSEGRARAPAGVRNINGYGAPEIIARTDGDCGAGSTRFTVVSSDGRRGWGIVYSACERTNAQEKVLFESKKDADGRELLTTATYAPDAPAGAIPVRSTTLIWNRNEWSVTQTGDVDNASRGPGLEARPPPGMERLQLRLPHFNRGPLFPGGSPGGELKLK